MDLKWFRARLTMNRNPKKSTTSIAGFYRSMSQFDSDVQLPQSSALHESNTAQSTHSVPPLSRPIAYNPMAGLNNTEIETSDVPRDIVWSPRNKTGETGDDLRMDPSKEPVSTDDIVPLHLPRESLELMRDASAEVSPRQFGSRSRKMDFKRKKGRAPIPKVANSGAKDGGRFVIIDKSRGSDASEIEI